MNQNLSTLLIRNNYTNFARPCLKCEAARGETGCDIYGTQCAECPLYKHWQQKKQPASFIRIPVSIENHYHEIQNISDTSTDITEHVKLVHQKMKKILKPLEWQVYKGLFIDNKDEPDIAKELGYISNEKGRNPGYKQIKNIRKIILLRAKEIISNGEISID